MPTNNKNLVEIFESERWLYADGSLEKKKKIFWDEQIKKNTALKTLLAEAQKYSTDFREELEADLKDSKFNTIVNNVFEQTNSNFFMRLIKEFFPNKKSAANSRTFKIAFTGSILIVIIVTLFSLRYSAPKQKINSNFLTWNDTLFNRKLAAAKFELSGISNKNVKKYIQYRLANDKWLRDVVAIRQEINQIILTVNNKSL